MTRIFLFSVFLGFLLGYTVRGHAAESGTSLAAALNYGPSSLSDGSAPGIDTHGTFRQAIALLSRSTARWSYGAGFGFFASDLTGKSRAAPASGAALALDSFSRTVSGEVARLSGRYRMGDHFEAGLSADLLFGSDVSFSSNLFDSSSSTAWLMGTELLYCFGNGSDLFGLRLKAGARAFASLGLPDRRLDAVQAVFEAGAPIF